MWLCGAFWVSGSLGLGMGLVAGVQAVSRWQGGRWSGGVLGRFNVIGFCEVFWWGKYNVIGFFGVACGGVGGV